MESLNKLPPSEDDDDIEALRLAALQSLKKKPVPNEATGFMPFGVLMEKPPGHFNGSPRGKFGMKNRRLPQGRPIRNGQFNNWTRNPNLISVPMVKEDDNVEGVKNPSDAPPKLILPQDRYCRRNSSEEEQKHEGATITTKFDRYDNSDESEDSSESDDENTSDRDDCVSLKKSNSLEAIMEELENEIQGGGGDKTEKSPVKEIKTKCRKKRKMSITQPVRETPDPTPEIDETEIKIEITSNEEFIANSPCDKKENLQPVISEKRDLEVEPNKTLLEPPPRKMSPKQAPNINFQRRKWHKVPPPQLPLPPPMNRRHNLNATFPPPVLMHQPPPQPYQTPPPMSNFGYPMGYNANYVPPPVFNNQTVYEVPPPVHMAPYKPERPLSPLSINTLGTDSYTSGTLAPLSPRSAAFVLQNRAIIEKRKRRSYSRSPSPRFRRSKTPKRSSVSPKRLSKSPISRRSLSPSPARKVLPLKTASPKKISIHNRLGAKLSKDVGSKLERDEEKPKKEEKKSDPILEARRRKFERKEITKTEGVIKLRKGEGNTRKSDEDSARSNDDKQIDIEDDEIFDEDKVDEDALLEGDDSLVLDTKLDTLLFSDEESDSDNEGRFKTKQETNQKVVVLPFTKLINGAKSDIKSESRGKSRSVRDSRRSERETKRRTNRSNSSSRIGKSSKSRQPQPEKSKQQNVPLVNDKKIEIKIRNPSKYEKSDSSKSIDLDKKPVSTVRKVEIAKKAEMDDEFNFDSAEEVLKANDGDLRAQLSRKRAERQKQPLPDVVPSRLLKSALQDAGFRKTKLKKKETSSVDNAEGKLPIHMRLGSSSQDASVLKKSRKHQKSQGAGLEQV